MVYERYGPPEVLEMREVEIPVLGDDDVLIRVEAASVNRSDWEGLIGRPLYARMGGLRRPRRLILGSDVAGRVEKVGSAVESFRLGDEVFGEVMYHGGSAFAEYVCVPETAPIVHKPATVTWAEASTLPQAGLIALQGTLGRIEPGDRVLVNGGGGGAGAFAVQMAKVAGAEVTGVDNGLKQEFMRSVGADHVFDYTRVDYTKMDTRYDFVLDLVGERSMFAIRRAVAPGGGYAVVGGSVPALLSAATVGRLLSTGGRRIGVLMVRPNKEDMLEGIIDIVIGEIDLPSAEADWKTAMRQRAISARRVLASHPWAIGMMESRRAMGPATLRYTDAVIGSLRTAGFSLEKAAHAFLLLDSYIYGFVVQETSFPVGGPEEAEEPAEAVPQTSDVDQYPHLAEMATEYVTRPGHNYADEFEFGLNLILDGLETHRDG